MKTQIITEYTEVKQTEKAICIKTLMDVGSQGAKEKEVWLPKSQVRKTKEGLAVAVWLINDKQSVQYMTYFYDIKRDKEMNILTVEIN